jgi:hypothetical protein
MFVLDVVVACTCVSSTEVLLWRSLWSCIVAVCVLLTCMYVTAFSLCLCYFYVREVFCLVRGGCHIMRTFSDLFNMLLI